MAGLNMSQALQNIGANLPNIFRQRQQDAIALQAQQAKQKKDEEESAQQAELQRVILDLKKGELDQANVASQMGAEGRKAVDEYTTSRNIRNLPISREYGESLSDMERANKYNLVKASAYEPSAKAIMDQINKNEELASKTTKSANKPFNLVGARLEYDTPQNRDLAKMQIDDALKVGTITEQQAKIAAADVDGGFAYDYNKSFREQGVEASLKRGVKVADEYALMAPRAATAEVTGYGGEIGKGKGKSDLPDETGLTNVDPTTGTAYTIQQKNDAQFAIRLQRSNKVLDELANSGFNESDVDKVILSNVDSNGNIKTNAINAIRDPKLRRYAQAKIDFVLSTLRKESGAAINANEYVGQAARYLPQAGDDPESLDQKRTARLSEEAGYLAAAGDAAMKYYQDTFKKVSDERPSPYKKPEPAAPPPASGTTAPIRLQGDKAKRLEELRRKQAEGTLK